jgi:aminoglycoside phosphotransferase (APT) family kinase protein
VLKAGGSVLLCEAEALRLIALKAPSLRVPRVHRSFQVEDPSTYFGTRGYIVMDYINGQQIDECWDSLDADARHSVVVQVTQMVRDMQSIVLPQPGPIAGGPSRGHLFTDYSAGPFKCAREMEGWFNHKLEMCQYYKRASQDLPPFKFTQFVLTHQDISPRNLILDDTGQVWMIDWADAGAYPPAFESAALQYQHGFPDFHESVLSLLPYTQDSLEVRQLRSIGFSLTTLAWA